MRIFVKKQMERPDQVSSEFSYKLALLPTLTDQPFAVPACVILLAFLLVWMLFRFRALSRKYRQLQKEKDVMLGFIEDIGDAFTDSEQVEVRDLLRQVLFYALTTTRSAAGIIYLREPNGQLRVQAISGIFPPLFNVDRSALEAAESRTEYLTHLMESRLLEKGESLIGEVVESGKHKIIECARDDPRLPRHPYDFLAIHSLLAVPMRFRDNIMGVLAVVNPTDGRSFNQGDLSLLQVLADQASVSTYYASLKDTLLEKERTDRELSIATEVQRAMLPGELPEFPRIKMAAFNQAARQVGGDYYDVIHVDEQHVGFAIADVAGKGIVGALMMAVCRVVLRIHAAGQTDPVAVLKAVHQSVLEDLPEDMFITMSYFVLNLETLELQLARAGHEPLLICRHATGKVVEVEPEGMALGLSDEQQFSRQIQVESVFLQTGDFIVLYTDGVTEAMNAEGEEWGKNTLIEAIEADSHEGVDAILENVKQRVLRFTGDMPQSDDFTLMVIGVE